MKNVLEEQKRRIIEISSTIQELDFGPKGMWRDEEGKAHWPGKEEGVPAGPPDANADALSNLQQSPEPPPPPGEMRGLLNTLANALSLKEWSLVEEAIVTLNNMLPDEERLNLPSKDESPDGFDLDEMEDYKVYKDEKDFSPEQKEKITNFVNNYKGDFEDEDIHKLADEMGLDTPEVEEFIYNMARK